MASAATCCSPPPACSGRPSASLLRYWRVSGTRAVAVVGALSVVVFAPLYALFVGYDGMLRMGLAENLLQVVVQGLLAGMLPIYLFARAVILLGAGRAATSRRWCRASR